jgi:hypothetical protein
LVVVARDETASAFAISSGSDDDPMLVFVTA